MTDRQRIPVDCTASLQGGCLLTECGTGPCTCAPEPEQPTALERVERALATGVVPPRDAVVELAATVRNVEAELDALRDLVSDD